MTLGGVSNRWLHFSADNYSSWYVGGGDTSPHSLWYTANGQEAGSVAVDSRQNAVYLYTCLGSFNVSRICAARAPTKGRLSMSSLEQSAFNPIEVDGADRFDPMFVKVSSNGAVVGVCGQTTEGAAAVTAYTTSDSSFQSGFEFSNVLYTDSNFSRFGTPDLFQLQQQNDDSFLKLTMVSTERDYVVYGALRSTQSGEYVFEEDSERSATLVDLGTMSAAKTFWDPLTGSLRIWGAVREDVTADTPSLQWSGTTSMWRVVAYDDIEKQVTFTPTPELKALRLQRVFSDTIELVEDGDRDGSPGSFYALNFSDTGSPTAYHEIIAEFDVSEQSNFSNQEVGLYIRTNEDASTYTSVSVLLPSTASCSDGEVDDQFLFRTVPLYNEFDDQDVSSCVALCEASSMCNRWEIVLRPYGMDCKMYTVVTDAAYDGVCGSQYGCPQSPLLVFNRSLSGSIGNTTSILGRAKRSRQSPGRFKLHVFVDDSVVEVFKDDGLETLTGRVYVPANQNGIALLAKNLKNVTARVEVFTMGSIWPSEPVYDSALERRVTTYTTNHKDILNLFLE